MKKTIRLTIACVLALPAWAHAALAQDPAPPQAEGPTDTPTETSPPPEATPAAPTEMAPPPPVQIKQHGGLRLTLVDGKTGEPVPGATVMIDGDARGETDADGNLLVRPLRTGPHSVLVMSGEYDPKDGEVQIDANVDVPVRYRLTQAEAVVFEVKAKASRPKREVTEIVLTDSEIKTVPGTMGDPVRVVENLPGMNRAPGGIGGALIVRGANPADSGVYIDGVEVPLLYHFGGLTSVINAEFLGGITFMPGGFGAQYGRATAGIVDVQTKPLTCDRTRALASIDPIDAEAFTCVPLGSWKLALAGRRSYVDAFLPALLEGAAKDGESPTIVTPAYLDYQIKAEHHDAHQRWDIFAFGARDTLKVVRATSAEDADFSLSGGVQFHRLQVRHTYFGNKLTLESALTPGLLKQDFGDKSAELDTQHRSGVTITSLSWKETATYAFSPYIKLRAGIDSQLYHWSADFITELPNLGRTYPSPLIVDPTRQDPWKDGNTDLHQGYWTELVVNPHPDVTLTPGLRVDHLDFDSTERFTFQPRLASRWQINEQTSVKASAGVYQKLPDLFSGVMVDGFGQPNLSAEKAVHITSGAERSLEAVNLSAEVFNVWRSNLPSPTDEVTYKDGKATPVLFKSDGRGHSYGLELMVKRNPAEHRRFNGWVAYTLSRSTRTDRTATLGGINQYASVDPGSARLYELPKVASTYLSPFDQTHILTAVGAWQLPWKMSLGFRFQLVSGNPTTPLEKGRSHFDADSDTYKVQNGSVARASERLPTFHRLDLRFDKRWDFKGWSLTSYLEVMNTYNRRPVEAVGYDYRYAERTELRGLPVLPIVGVKGEI
ncbi:MAG: TonB-dependent receptor [Deltaproteobacteria bacterium]|nr:TonB-dependent receptor [Deltaproteobacteria bacterium]